MTTEDKIKHLYEKCMADLDSWEQDFISDLYENVQDAEEELTRRQIEKVDEVWEGLGL